MSFEGGVLAALIAAIGIAPDRRVMPVRLVHPVPLVDLSGDVSADVADVAEDDASDGSDGQTGDKPIMRPASTRAFVKWWRDLKDVPPEITQRYLLGLYHEFCEVTDVVPLSDRQLVNTIKRHGVAVSRPPARIVNGKQRRPTYYAIKGRRAS